MALVIDNNARYVHLPDLVRVAEPDRPTLLEPRLLALERDQYGTAASEYRKAAELGDDPDVAERATALSFELEQHADGLASAQRWVELDPDNQIGRAHV